MHRVTKKKGIHSVDSDLLDSSLRWNDGLVFAGMTGLAVALAGMTGMGCVSVEIILDRSHSLGKSGLSGRRPLLKRTGMATKSA